MWRTRLKERALPAPRQSRSPVLCGAAQLQGAVAAALRHRRRARVQQLWGLGGERLANPPQRLRGRAQGHILILPLTTACCKPASLPTPSFAQPT